MSELKVRFIDDTYVEYYNTGKHDLAQVYIKSEADKVIAELKAREDVLVTDNRNLLDKVKKLEERLHENAEHFKRNEAQILENTDNMIAELQKQVHDYAQGLYVIQAKAEKEARHAKHKRCLANARIAQDDWHLHNSFYAMGHQEFEKRKCDFYDKWNRRWLKIAEKFNEAK